MVNLGGEFLLLMLYNEEEKIRRDSTKWTLVQGVLAPLQFVVFLISLGFVLNYLIYGTYESAASISVVMKTFILCLIMVTGSIWEKAVFDKYLFATPFYWEDIVSIVVASSNFSSSSSSSGSRLRILLVVESKFVIVIELVKVI